MMQSVKVRISQDTVTVRSEVCEVTFLREALDGEWIMGIDVQRLYAALDWVRISPFIPGERMPVDETVEIVNVDPEDPENVDRAE